MVTIGIQTQKDRHNIHRFLFISIRWTSLSGSRRLRIYALTQVYIIGIQITLRVSTIRWAGSQTFQSENICFYQKPFVIAVHRYCREGEGFYFCMKFRGRIRVIFKLMTIEPYTGTTWNTQKLIHRKLAKVYTKKT